MSYGYRQAKIWGNPYQVRDELRNWDIWALPWSRKRDDDGFFFIKRKSYVNLLDNESLWVKWRRVTDSRRVDESWCSDWECYTYYYVASPNRTQYKVLKRECWSCDIFIFDEGKRCACAEDKFFDVFSSLSDWINIEWTIYNDWTNWFVRVEQNVWVTVWEYLFIHWLQQGSEAVCWQARLVVSIDEDENGDYVAQVDSPWTSLSAWEEYPWAILESTPDVWFVPAYIGQWWISTIVEWGFWEVVCDYWRCLTSVVNHNGQLNYITEQWFNFFSSTWFDWSFVSANNVNNVWLDKFDSVSFKNFLVFFGKNTVWTNVYSEDWEYAYYNSLRDDIGIYNRGAYAKFDNGLFFIWSDKRVYWASINSNWNWIFDLQLEDITKNVFHHMELVQDWDEVYMGSYSDRMYIFINWKSRDWNSNTNKSKILIYDKTYWLWLVHEVCSQVINNIKYWEFLWGWIYEYCGRQWDWVVSNWFWEPYTAIASWLLYKNDNHWLTSQNWLPLDMFRRHKLVNAVTLLWQGKYTEDTRIEVDRYREYKASRYYAIDTENETIDNWNRWWDWERIEPSECFLDQLSDCDNIKNPCIWSAKNFEVDVESCWWCQERRIYEDYCVCYDDNQYQVSKVHKFNMRFDDWFADYWRVTFVSWWYDVANFGWMIIKTYSEADFDVDVDEFTADCCSRPIVCNSSC